jgi:NOL1/NOP2/fmu family ribosome biogenesis protein
MTGGMDGNGADDEEGTAPGEIEDEENGQEPGHGKARSKQNFSHQNRHGKKPHREDSIKPSEVKESTLHYLEERFGIPRSIFEGYSLYLGPKCRVYLGPAQVPPSLRIVSPGLLVARADSGIKPSTNLFQLFGREVSKNIVNLERASVPKFVKGDDLLISTEERKDATDGYVLVRYQGYDLGCALLKGPTLKNQVPKAKRLGLGSF